MGHWDSIIMFSAQVGYQSSFKAYIFLEGACAIL